MPLVLNAVVFDEFLNGTTPLRTSPDLNGVIGEPDNVWLFCVVTEIGGIAPTLIVQIETSGDDIDYSNLNENAEVNRVTLTAGFKNVFKAGPFVNAFAFARLRVELGASDDRARVVISISGRDSG